MTRSRLIVALALAAFALVVAANRLTPRSKPTEPVPPVPPETAHTSLGDLWVFSVGVSQYRDRGLDLRFAESDARALAEALSQGASGLYRDVHAKVLVDAEVTRENVLASVTGFLGGAGPDDVVVLFLAGHGVQEPNTGSYYFLPYAAGREDFVTTGVRMSDISEVLRALRRNVRRVVVLLDTCHAGAGQLAASGPLAGDPWTEDSFDGFFLLAAARANEPSKEIVELGHGVFTWALLEGLHGAADPDHDAKISVADLFAFVAREVPRRTGGRQHPYQRIEGSDSPFASVTVGATSSPGISPARFEEQEATIAPPSRASIAVLRFDNLRGDPQHDWIGMALLSAFNTDLTRARTVEVYAPELLSGGRAMRADDLSAARRLGITKVLAGTYSVFGDAIRIDARIIDSSTRRQEASATAEGPLSEFFALQRRIVDSLSATYPAALPTPPAGTTAGAVEKPLNAYKLLLQAEGLPGLATPAPTSVVTPPADGPRSSVPFLVTSAFADEPTSVERAAVDALLERYRLTLERADVDAYAAVYASFSEAQRTAIRAYFDNAKELQVRISQVELRAGEQGPVVSFARHDSFLDRESGRRAELDVRLIKALVQVGGEWKFAPPAP